MVRRSDLDELVDYLFPDTSKLIKEIFNECGIHSTFDIARMEESEFEEMDETLPWQARFMREMFRPSDKTGLLFYRDKALLNTIAHL